MIGLLEPSKLYSSELLAICEEFLQAEGKDKCLVPIVSPRFLWLVRRLSFVSKRRWVKTQLDTLVELPIVPKLRWVDIQRKDNGEIVLAQTSGRTYHSRLAGSAYFITLDASNARVTFITESMVYMRHVHDPSEQETIVNRVLGNLRRFAWKKSVK